MATNNRKTRSDSISGAKAAMSKVQSAYPTFPDLMVTKDEDPATHDKVLLIFNDILTIRSPEDWRKPDVPIVARIAMVIVEIDRYETMMRRTGVLIKGGKNNTTTIANPISQHLDRLYSRLKQLSGHIGLDSLPKDSRQLGNNAQAHQMANEAITKALSYSDLI